MQTRSMKAFRPLHFDVNASGTAALEIDLTLMPGLARNTVFCFHDRRTNIDGSQH